MPLLHSQRIVQGRFGTGGGGGGGEIPISKIVQRDYIFLLSLFHPFSSPPHGKGSRRGDTHRERAGVRWTTFLSLPCFLPSFLHLSNFQMGVLVVTVRVNKLEGSLEVSASSERDGCP